MFGPIGGNSSQSDYQRQRNMLLGSINPSERYSVAQDRLRAAERACREAQKELAEAQREYEIRQKEMDEFRGVGKQP